MSTNLKELREKIISNTILPNNVKKKFLKELEQTELNFYIRTAPADVKRLLYDYTNVDSDYSFLNGIPFTQDNFCKFFKISKELYKANEEIFEKGENENIAKYIDIVYDEILYTGNENLYMILDIIFYIMDNYMLKDIYLSLFYNKKINYNITNRGSTDHLDQQLIVHKISKEFYDNMLEKYEILKKKIKKVEKFLSKRKPNN